MNEQSKDKDPSPAEPADGLSLPIAQQKPQPAVVRGNVYRNTDVNIIEVNEEKVRLALQGFAKRSGGSDWIAPLGIELSLITVLITAEFKGKHFGLHAGTWHDIFIVATVAIAVWLVAAVRSRLRQGGTESAIDDCITQIKGTATKKGTRLGP